MRDYSSILCFIRYLTDWLEAPLYSKRRVTKYLGVIIDDKLLWIKPEQVSHSQSKNWIYKKTTSILLPSCGIQKSQYNLSNPRPLKSLKRVIRTISSIWWCAFPSCIIEFYIPRFTYCEAKLHKRALRSWAEQFAKTRNISILWLCFYDFLFHFFNFSNTRDRERKGATWLAQISVTLGNVDEWTSSGMQF